MQSEIQKLRSEIDAIQARNQNVELDKKWEGSLTRKILIGLFTYLAVSFYLSAIEIKDPWLNAIVPTIGFLLSTLTMPFFKKIWSKYQI